MNVTTYIRCPGCETVVDAATPVCPGCGRCLACGRRRAESTTHCSRCGIPYCRCCGDCPVCLGLRHSEIVDPCECGHPGDPEVIRKLAERFAVAQAREIKGPQGAFHLAYPILDAVRPKLSVTRYGLLLWTKRSEARAFYEVKIPAEICPGSLTATITIPLRSAKSTTAS